MVSMNATTGTFLTEIRMSFFRFEKTQIPSPLHTEVELQFFNSVVDRFGSVEAILLTDLLTHSV
jgi:hypothetical protein